MSRHLVLALKGVCDELETFAPNSPALHFARGILACGPLVARDKKPREPRTYNGKYLPQAEQIVADYVGGKTLLEVSSNFGCGTNLVKRLLDERGIACRPQGQRRIKKNGPDPRVPEFMAMRKQGMTASEIGTHFGISRERVRQLIELAGLKEQFAERPFKPEELAILKEYAAGDPLEMTAKKLGINWATAKNWIERAGIELRRSTKLTQAREKRDALAARIAEEYLAGKTTRALADEFGFKSPENIYRYLAVAGVRANRCKRRPLSALNGGGQ